MRLRRLPSPGSGDFELAGSAEATDPPPGEDVLWQIQEALACMESANWQAALWHIDRALALSRITGSLTCCAPRPSCDLEISKPPPPHSLGPSLRAPASPLSAGTALSPPVTPPTNNGKPRSGISIT